MNQSMLKFFADYIEANLGIVYVEANYFQLEHRLQQIVTQLGFMNLEDLYGKAKIRIDGMMKNLLLDLATNNETSFFRDAAIFKAFSQFVVPETIEVGGLLSSINVWSAACSSGQEAYSIAMEYEGCRQANPGLPRLSMRLSDISETILKRAQEGLYSQLEVQRGLPARNLIQYFDKVDDDKWRVKSILKTGIEFKKINLLEEWGRDHGPFHVIFCRNVLIYQNVDNKKKVIEKLCNHLAPRGFLFLGAAESMFGISNSFEQLESHGAIVHRKRA